MRRSRHEVLGVLIFALLCFSCLFFAGSLAAQESKLKQNHTWIDSTTIGWNVGSGWGNWRDWRGWIDFGNWRDWIDWGNWGGNSNSMRVRLSTRQSQIDWGDSAALKWSCRNAESCVLEPGVGALDPNGSGTVDVSPRKTTKYTLTAKKSGSIARSSVIITVINIPPTISILQPADGSTLTLGIADSVPASVEYSDDRGIDTDSFSANLNNQDITGLFTATETGATGILPIRLPVGDNTLSVTVSDIGGISSSATSQFTVNYLPPTVSLSAPPAVKYGESVTLAWQAINADTLNIEPGIGQVGLNNSITVSLYEKTTYTITATGPGGTATDSVEIDVTDIPPPGIYYKYDELGRIKRIIRMPAARNP